MKMFAYSVLAVLVLTGICFEDSMAADASFGADVNSAYVWRGITFNDGVVVQPLVQIGHDTQGHELFHQFRKLDPHFFREFFNGDVFIHG